MCCLDRRVLCFDTVQSCRLIHFGEVYVKWGPNCFNPEDIGRVSLRTGPVNLQQCTLSEILSLLPGRAPNLKVYVSLARCCSCPCAASYSPLVPTRHIETNCREECPSLPDKLYTVEVGQSARKNIG